MAKKDTNKAAKKRLKRAKRDSRMFYNLKAILCAIEEEIAEMNLKDGPK
jgi:hypothetical protein